MRTFAIQDIRDLSPCYDPSEKLPEDWTGTSVDVLRLDHVPPEDRLWVVSHWLDDRTLRLFAVWCARVAERHAATYGELSDTLATADSAAYAAYYAAHYAAQYTADSAAHYAAQYTADSAADAADAAADATWAAAWVAAWADAWADACASAWTAQIKHLITMIEDSQ